MVFAISFFVSGFTTNAFMPAILALSASRSCEYPVHMMIGMFWSQRQGFATRFDARQLGHCLARNDEIETTGVFFKERKGPTTARR
jgi:hypothetical protein